jgi:Mg2+-importing ATPase
VCLLQLVITALDAATVWVSIQALGWGASAPAVFGSFMISQLAGTVGLLPGGLGAFEVSSVLTLGLNAVPLPVALSATLLFRGVSFWLPMIPGAWYARRLFTSKPRPSDAVSLEGGTPEAAAAADRVRSEPAPPG